MAKILIVEDEKITSLSFCKSLNQFGYETAEAQNGKEAVEKVQTEPFDLIIMDLMMPVMDGFEAIRQIRETKSLTFIPIIVISALESPEDIKKALELGADEYVTKPVDEVALRARVMAALRLKETYEKLQSKVEELEDFHDAAVGRELEMVKLEEENKILKDELEKRNIDKEGH